MKRAFAFAGIIAVLLRRSPSPESPQPWPSWRVPRHPPKTARRRETATCRCPHRRSRLGVHDRAVPLVERRRRRTSRFGTSRPTSIPACGTSSPTSSSGSWAPSTSTTGRAASPSPSMRSGCGSRTRRMPDPSRSARGRSRSRARVSRSRSARSSIDTPRGPLELGPFDVDTGGARARRAARRVPGRPLRGRSRP